MNRQERTRALTLGEEVYMVRYGGYSNEYHKAVVVRITPKGFVDVKFAHSASDPAAKAIRFAPTGHEHGERFGRGYAFDEMAVSERDIFLAELARRHEATVAIKEILEARFPYSGVPDKASLVVFLDDIQSKITRVRELVAAI